MKPIIKTPHQVLTTPTKEVAKIDKKVQQIISELIDTLNGATDPKGVGLAATQIGKSMRIFVIKPTEKNEPSVFINPRFITLSDELLKGIPDDKFKLEGCLSIPNVWGLVNRHKSITLQYMDEKSQEHEAVFSDFEAIIIQHEMDHLDGVLFPRRVLEQCNKLYTITHDTKGEEILTPIDI